jgi:putative DNA primase/helicase
MDRRAAARLLGGEVVGNKILCPGPAHSRADRSLAVTFSSSAPDGFTVHSFAGDTWTACKDHVRAALGIKRERVPVEFSEQSKPTDTIKFALDIWGNTQSARGTIVETYLLSRRIKFPDCADIRYHPSLKYDDVRLPSMVALFRDIVTDEPCGIHRTFLNPNGTKRDRRMLGRAKGAAIKLDADENVSLGLVIGEGIETCLSGRELGFGPSWSLGSADAIASFPVLSGIECITFLGEDDKTGANERAIKSCAKRWLSTGAQAILQLPVSGDMNSVLADE